MVDIGDLKSPDRKIVWVRVPPRAPKQNESAFSKPSGGTREARPTDFLPFFQTNSERRLGRRALFSRQEAGSKSRAIQIQKYLLWLQKEFLLQYICAQLLLVNQQKGLC